MIIKSFLMVFFTCADNCVILIPMKFLIFIKKYISYITLLSLFIFIIGCKATPTPTPPTPTPEKVDIIQTIGKWKTIERVKTQLLEIYYNRSSDSNEDYAQYGVIDLKSSYFRLNYGPQSLWGTSVCIFPPFWKKEGTTATYYQGCPITYAINKSTNPNQTEQLVLDLTGTNQGIYISGWLTINPPEGNSIMAKIYILVQNTNNITIDFENHPNEAFKPVFISSMRINDQNWDANFAFAGSQKYTIPASGLFINPPVSATIFGVEGGTSDWQKQNGNLPCISIKIELNKQMNITGFVTSSNNPNDDNVGFWAATSKFSSSWEYTITATDVAFTPIIVENTPALLTQPSTIIKTSSVTTLSQQKQQQTAQQEKIDLPSW